MIMLDRMRDEDLRRGLGQEAVLSIVKVKQRGWKVKVEYMKIGDDSLLFAIATSTNRCPTAIRSISYP